MRLSDKPALNGRREFALSEDDVIPEIPWNGGTPALSRGIRGWRLDDSDDMVTLLALRFNSPFQVSQEIPMVRISSAVVLMILCLASISAADSPTPIAPSVTACGIRIVAPPYGGSDNLRAFNWFSGTSIALQLTMPTGSIVALYRDASVVTAVTDDKGTDLTKEDKTKHFHQGGIGMGQSISADGKACLFEIAEGGIPIHGASQIHLKGTLAIACATQKKTFVKDKVSLMKGTPIALGSLAFTVSEVEASDNDMTITLQTSGGREPLAAIRFIDADGKEIKSEKTGWSSRGSTKDALTSLNYTLKAKSALVTVSADVWTDIHDVSVPFDVTVGVGF